MAARDDSVIRGSLIACSIFLVLSLILNVLLWQMGDTASTEAATAKTQLTTANNEVRKQKSQIEYLMAVIGVGEQTEAEMEQLAASGSGDPNMEKVINNVSSAMSYFGPEVDPSRKNLSALPEYLVSVVRAGATQYSNVSQLLETEKLEANAAIGDARKNLAAAEESLKETQNAREKERLDFEADRKAMNLEKSKLNDVLTIQNQNHLKTLNERDSQIASLTKSTNELIATVESQRREINTLRNTDFEVEQGRIAYTRSGDRAVVINLGSADKLRNGITFGVFDEEVSSVSSSKPKAMIEVVRVTGEHVAQARIVGDIYASDPIITGDKIYSPFWSPGRTVRVAIAGEIDVNNNGKGDAEDINILTGMIQAAGAEVAAVVGVEGQQRGRQPKLDSSIRFLVIGERPEVSDAALAAGMGAKEEARLAQMGEIIDQARQLGINIITADKLLGFLKTIDDSITIPLGDNARASDFEPLNSSVPRRAEGSVSDLFNKEGQ